MDIKFGQGTQQQHFYKLSTLEKATFMSLRLEESIFCIGLEILFV